MPDTLLAEPPAALIPGLGSAYRHLPVLKAAVLNLAATALVAAAWNGGLVVPLFAADTTYQCHLIALLFAGALALCLQRVVQVSRELNEVRERRFAPGSSAGRFVAQAARLDGQGRAALAGALKLKLAGRIAGVRHFGNLLVLLGLIGTVVGFIMALGGVDPDHVADAGSIGPMVARLIEGMGVALNTTLLGSVLNIWLNLNTRLLETGTLDLLTRLIEATEAPSHV